MNVFDMARKKRPRSEAEAVTASSVLRPVVHYDDTWPFPTIFDDDFPSLAYRSRNGEVKTCCHWGQRKLLLSEIQLLVMYAKRGVKYHIVYAGSAPGSHLGFLDEMFDSFHTWELVDPGHFDRAVLGRRPNFMLRNEFFTNAVAYGINARRLLEAKLPGLHSLYRLVAVDGTEIVQSKLHQELQTIVGTLDVARGTIDIPSMYEVPLKLPLGLELLCQVAMERRPLLFVSDIRSGCVSLPNFEDHVFENMKAQQCWTEILQGDYSMLKFRLPYTFKALGPGGALGTTHETVKHLIDDDGCVEYLDGEMVIPIWTRPTSTEGRLVVPRGAARRRYNVRKVEDQFFFFNSKIREEYHFNHCLLPHDELDAHFDAAAEVHCLRLLCLAKEPHLGGSEMNAKLAAKIDKYSKAITGHLKLTFAAAVRRRDALIVDMARRGISTEHLYDADDADIEAVQDTPLEGKRVSWEDEAQRMIHAARRERQRPIWWRPFSALSPSQSRGSLSETESPLWRGVAIPLSEQ